MKKIFVIDMTDRFQFVAKTADSARIHANNLVQRFYRKNDYCEFVCHKVEQHENNGYMCVEIVVNRVCAVVADTDTQAVEIIKPFMKKSTKIVTITEEEE